MRIPVGVPDHSKPYIVEFIHEFDTGDIESFATKQKAIEYIQKQVDRGDRVTDYRIICEISFSISIPELTR